MSSTGQGDQLDELSKDNDSEISSTTPDNSGEKSCVSVPTKTDSEAIPDSTFEPVIEGPGTPTAGDALNVASTTAECIKDVDAEPIIEDDAESIPGNDDKVSEDVLEPNKSQVNETKKMILAKADVNSDSLAEDFVLRWEKNYDDGMDETTPTDDVLRELDLAIQNIGPTDNANDDKSESIVNLESVAEKSELDNVGPDMQLDSNKKTGETVQDVKSPDSKNKECHVKVPPSDDPNKDEFDIEDILRKNEENSKILESDDVEMASSELLDEAVDSEKAMEISVTENMKKIEVDSTSIGETKETEKTMDFSDTENIKKVAVDPISIDKTKVEKTMDICDTENIERIVKDSTSIKETVKAEKTVNISVAENIEKFVVSGPLESLTRAISDQDIFTEKDSIAAIEKPCEKTVQVDAEKKPEPLPKDVEMDFDTEIVSEKSVVEDNQTKKDQIEVITKNINQDINEISKDIECPSNKDDDNQVKVAKINVDVAVTSDTHDSNTPSDNPIVSPIEVSQISNIVDPMNEIPSESPSKLELSEKDDAGDKRELVCEIKGKGDENISLVSIVDKSITPNIHHRINKPNVMLDIPTQELSDIEAELEDDDDLELYNEDRNRKTQEISCMEVDSDKIDEKTDIDLKESKDQKTLSDNINSKLETMDIDTLVDNGAPQVSISPTKSEIIPSKIQDLPSTKSLQADVDSSKTILESDTCEKLLTSTLDEKIIEKPSTIEIDYEKPLTSMLTDEIDNDKPSISESIQEIDDDKPSKTKQDDDQPLTSTREVDADIPSTSKSTEQTDDQNLDDDKSSKSVQEINEKPLTSNLTDGVNDEKSPTSKLKQEVVEIPSASKSSLKIDEEPSTSKLTDDIDGQKLTITKSLQDIDEKTSKSETHDQKPAASKSTQKVDDQSSTSKSTIQVADQKPEQEIDDQNSSTSKSIQDVDDQPSTSKSTQELNDQKLPSSKSTIVIDDQKPTLTQLTGEIDDQNPSSSQSTQEPDDQKPSSSQSTQELDDQKPSSSIQEMDDQQPSTSKSETLVADNDETEDVTDSLGLLAESSRVMDDDNDDDDDPDVDDNDEDDDFDPYEETNSEMAEDIDDSNTPPPDLDPKDKPDPSPKVQEERESDEGTMDIAEGSIDIVDDIDCEENDLSEMEIPDEITETPLTEIPEKEDEPEIIDADSHKEKIKFPPEKIINILEKVLGPHGVTGVSKETKGGTVRSYVELEGSSDSDDVQEISKPVDSNVVSVNIPMGVEVMSTSGPCSTSEIVSKEGEVIISGVPKPPPHKMSKINTSEVSIKTTGISTPSMHIPETIVIKSKTDKDEIFNLDSDDDETEKKTTLPKMDEKIGEDSLPVEQDPLNLLEKKCINPNCSTESQTYYIADRVTAAYYSLTRRSAVVCEQCRIRASERSEALINGIKDLRPLLELQMDAPSQQLVEISDSDSEGEAGDDTSRIGDTDAMYLEEHLADMINETWEKYKMESRLKETESYLLDELEKIEADAKEINAMLDECQTKTDAVRLDFYKDYEPRRKSVGGIVIHDTPFSSYSHTEKDIEDAAAEVFGSRYPKRRATSAAVDTPAKRAAIPMGYTPLDGDKPIPQSENDQSKVEDDKEVSVVKLSAESAPPDLPPCGEIIRPSLKTGMIIYAMRNAFGTWLKGRIMEVQPKAPGQQFTQCRVKFEHKIKNPCKVLAARCLAYPDPSDVRMTIGTRVVALFKDPHNSSRRESFYSGVIAEIPNPVNGYRYLVFFDDGYAQYVQHQDTRVVCESSPLVWEEVHPFIRDFICNYLLSYPERPMVRLHAGEKLKTEWNGKWWESKVLQVDASIALIHFDEDNRTEWIYRGSTRLAPLYLELQAAEKAGEGRTRSRAPRSKAQTRSNMPCVEYTRSDEQAAAKAAAETQALQQHNEEMRRQRAVAKKSTTSVNTQQPNVAATPLEGVISRVVYYTPKNAVKPYKMSTHICTVKCRRSDLLTLKDLRTYNPLAKPLLSGWEKQTIRHKGQKEVAYRAPCGRRLRNMTELHKYLRIIQSDLSVDLFDFTPGTHCLAEFVLNKCIVSKKDLSHGKENVPVPCVNYFDDSLPEFCSYNTERTPTAGVPLNLDPEFLCGCDCTDDCVDKSKCACWKMTLEGARTIGLEGPNVGYVYRRLPEPLPSGIYECNSRCKCKQTCLNRVAQHPLQLKLQVFKTINRGWGIRALNDVPKGSFLCVYAGNLLTDATANLDGINEGDEYLAELDYIEVVEGMKEGYEDDIPDADKKLDKKGDSSSGSDSTESEEEQDASNRDDDFQPGYIPQSNVLFKKSLRRREKAKKKEEEKLVQAPKKNDCITISDDEEVREPSRFTAQAGMVDRDLVSKQSSRVSVRTLFGKDEACYIVDAKVQGNIGRYLNHSCHPNVFVQNVFVDTHDPRFPWVAFFALSHVRAGTELTWNYNYDIGSVPEKVLYCYCGAPNCRGRLL